MPRTEGSTDLDIQTRAAIITCRHLAGMEWPQIAGKLQISPAAAHRVYHKALAEAGAGKDVNISSLLSTLQPSSFRKGPHPKVNNGSSESRQIRQAILDNPDPPFHIAAGPKLDELGLQISPSTVRRVAREHTNDPVHPKPIKRLIRPKKPKLSMDHKQQRIQYSEWLNSTFKRLENRVIFVCYDETYKSFGGSVYRGKKRVSMEQGSDPNELPFHEEDPKFQLMICAATSTYIHAKRPIKIWVQDDTTAKEALIAKIAKQAEKEGENVQQKRTRAYQEGTQEHRILQEANINIMRHNEQIKRVNPAARKGLKKLFTANRLFKPDKIKYSREQKGMNGPWYAENILRSLVFPYYHEIRRQNPDHTVFLIHDNVRIHRAAERYLKSLIEDQQILFAPHPPRSPDLHPIERCFGRLEAFLDDYKVSSSTQAEKQAAEAFVKELWQENTEMEEYMAYRLRVDSFKELASLCILHKGDNNFTA